MDSIDLTVYLVNDIVSGPVCMFQAIYLDSNTLITIGCQPVKSPSVDNLVQLCIIPIWQEISFGISHCIVDCLLVSGGGGRLNRSIEMLLFVQEE